MRSAVRVWIVAFVVGTLTLAAAWAGVGLGPVPVPGSPQEAKGPDAKAPVASAATSPGTVTLPSGVGGVVAARIVAPQGARLPAGQFLVGANRTSIAPAPEQFGGTEWQTDGCFEIEQANPNLDHALPAPGHGWPLSTPNCIYLGGFGIGPARAARTVDDGGVWVRSIAISNGESTVVWQVIDSVGYFYRYQGSACADCGFYDIRNAISAQTGVPADNIVDASTHSHSGPDNYGGWGGVPDWYWHQLRDSVIASAKQAIANLHDGTIDAGSLVMRRFNNERRDHYYSTPDYQAVWLQARDANGVVATLANFAGHPTIVNTPRPQTPTWNGSQCVFVAGPPTPLLHADWPGAAARGFESSFGGVGLLFEGGLGNVSVSGQGWAPPPCDATSDKPVGDNVWSSDDLGAEATGRGFASIVGADIARNATRLQSNDIVANVQPISHPIMTNKGLAALGSLGLFSREFIPGTPGADGPGAYHWSKDRNPDRPGYLRGCDSASEVQVRTLAGAHRVGEFGVAFAPGEIFSNMTEVVKSKRRNNVAMATFGQANDALGYIIQSFEFDYTTSAATEYGTTTAEYEEVFAIDHCFGDHVTQAMLDAAGAAGL